MGCCWHMSQSLNSVKRICASAVPFGVCSRGTGMLPWIVVKFCLCMGAMRCMGAVLWQVMVEMVMDVLRALGSPNLDIRRKTLDIALDLITPRNIDEVVLTLKKEVVKTQNRELEKGGEYRQMLVQAIHSCAVKFPDVAGSVVHLLMDFLGDQVSACAAAAHVLCNPRVGVAFFSDSTLTDPLLSCLR